MPPVGSPEPSRREQELVILRVAHLRESDYEWSHHTRLGKRAGVTSAAREMFCPRANASTRPQG